MRTPSTLLALALAAALPVLAVPAGAQSAPAAAPACAPAEANVGGIGRAHVVRFTGAVFGASVCALSVGLPFDSFAAAIADGPPPAGALVVASLGTGSAATLAVRGENLALLAPPGAPAALTAAAPPQPAASGDPEPGAPSAESPASAPAAAPAVPGPEAAAVGPYVVAPGGSIPDFNGDTSELPRVVLGYAGQRTFVIATSPVELVDLAKALRDEPDLFGADEAFERAIVLASGPSAALVVRGADGELRGGAAAAPSGRVLILGKRG